MTATSAIPCLPRSCGLDSGSGLARRPERRTGRDFGALSASPSQVILAPSWKQEVNRRLAAHKSRTGSSTAEPHEYAEAQGGSSRAAQAAARVAARYAKAPSYSEMLAGEARAAVRAAEAASRAALNAQAAAESILAGLEAESRGESAWEAELPFDGLRERSREPAAHPDVPSLSRTPGVQPREHRLQPDIPERQAEAAAIHEQSGQCGFELPRQDWWEPAPSAQDALDDEAVESVEPAQSVFANLIEFPREIVAPRRVRPRRAEGPLADTGEPDRQLSIFEVDPGGISVQPVSSDLAAESAEAKWQAPEWSGIELDAEPIEEMEPETEPVKAAQTLQLAAMSWRSLAAVVDGTLIAGVFLAAALVAAYYMRELPGIKEIEIGSAAALLGIGALYQAFFLMLAEATPGMKYAHISYYTFDGRRAGRAQRRHRLGALLLSVAPLGLGVAWAIFDEDHLSWHDRLSRTYLRRS